MTDSTEQALLSRLAELTGTNAEDWYLSFRARHGMQLIFEAIREAFGSGSIITQAYTCVTAVNPIVAAGLTPEYADITADTVAIDPSKVALHSKAHAIIMQHTFGLIGSAHTRDMRRLADEQNMLLIEDSAHCVTAMARDEDGSIVSDISIHSFGSEKILGTKFGGAIWVNPGLEQKYGKDFPTILRRRLSTVKTPGWKTRMAAKLYLFQIRAFAHLPSTIAQPAKRGLEKTGFFLPLITDSEHTGGNGGHPLGTTSWINQNVNHALASLAENTSQRKSISAKYLRELAPYFLIPESADEDNCLVRFPLFITPDQVKSGITAEELFSVLAKAGFHPGRWYRPPLFPGVENFSLYNLDPALTDLPVTRQLCDTALNLPTLIPEEEADRIIATIKSYLSEHDTLNGQ